MLSLLSLLLLLLDAAKGTLSSKGLLCFVQAARRCPVPSTCLDADWVRVGLPISQASHLGCDVVGCCLLLLVFLLLAFSLKKLDFSTHAEGLTNILKEAFPDVKPMVISSSRCTASRARTFCRRSYSIC